MKPRSRIDWESSGMHRQSINQKSLSALLRRSDYVGVASGLKAAHGAYLTNSALVVARDGLPATSLKTWPLYGKPHFAPANIAIDLLIRNLASNLQVLLKKRLQGRHSIVSNLRQLISESVPYRIYRLDVRSFYESFSTDDLCEAITGNPDLAPATRRLCAQLLTNQKSNGHEGLPRGLAISAIISEAQMSSFDDRIASNAEVFFYARFVDDIIILTSGEENASNFLSFASSKLPPGLEFSEDETKKQIVEFKHPAKKGPAQTIGFDYLGYSFTAHSTTPAKSDRREIALTIAPKKVARIKKRIIRTLLDFANNKDEALALDRVKLLTSNFSIYNVGSGRFNTTGIYFSYPHIDFPSQELIDLDRFLRHAVLSKNGKVFAKIGAALTSRLRNKILKHSFSKGHEQKTFCHFSGNRLKLLQECWKY